MSMFPHVVSVLNKYEDDLGDAVYKVTKLSGVLYVESMSTSKALTGSDNKDNKKCTIPFSVDTNGKQFLSPVEYNKLKEPNRGSYWTLRKDDIIVHGDVTENNITLKFVNNNYDKKLIISFVDTFDFGSLRHWLVGGA